MPIYITRMEHPDGDRWNQHVLEHALYLKDLIAQGLPEEMVHDIVRKVDRNEYKRKQAAPGLKITPLAFGVGRRIPIVQKYVG